MANIKGFYKSEHLLYKKIGEDIWGKYTARAQSKSRKLGKKLNMLVNHPSFLDDTSLVKTMVDHKQPIILSNDSETIANQSKVLTYTKYAINKTQNKTLSTKEKFHLFRIDIRSPKPRKVVKSAYRKILEEKQKIKAFYGNLSQKQLSRIFTTAKTISGNPIQNFFGLLESRVDMILFRANLVNTLGEARQLLSHGFIKINNHTIKRPNYLADPLDLITIHPRIFPKLISKLIAKLRKNLVLVPTPNYIETNYNTGKLVLVYRPSFAEISYPIKIKPNYVSLFFR